MAALDYTSGADQEDTWGHGSMVAGCIVGNASTGLAEPTAMGTSFYWGIGVAPGARFVSQNFVSAHAPWPPASWNDYMIDSCNQGAHVQNNSWGIKKDGVPAGYNASARQFDILVRDPNPIAAELQQLIIVFSAGNEGPNSSTLSSPHEFKNPIVVGSSNTYRPGVGALDDIRGIDPTSSRGPALDGRILPNVVAPGVDVSSLRSAYSPFAAIAGTGVLSTGSPPLLINAYSFGLGTSLSAAHVSGVCAVLVQWWEDRTSGGRISHAMAKALLINGAVDLAGGPSGKFASGGAPIPLGHIPNSDQGWGRVNLRNILLNAPATDRGPKLFFDQSHAFTSSGQSFDIKIAPVSTTRPMRVTLAWTDAAGAVSYSSKTLVNDLDLEIVEVATGHIYNGGNDFSLGFSIHGGVLNDKDNIECIYIENPTGMYELSVRAANLAGSAHPAKSLPWQDFALVIDNAEIASTGPTSIVLAMDRSSSMVAAGYESATRQAIKGLIERLSVDDTVAVVSFGSSSTVEYPLMPLYGVQPITGQASRDAAKAAVDGVSFGGCTNIGEAITSASNLLSAVGGKKGIFLVSDGYDNKGCDPTNPSKPSASEAAAVLPSDIPIYSCGLGPLSDVIGLESLATTNGGRFYYMPTVDEIFEIYNYIRGQVSGDAIVVNETAMASTSRIPFWIDADCNKATIAVQWHDASVEFTPREPTNEHSVFVRLRNPRGKAVVENCSYVRTRTDRGSVTFDIQQPAAGKWYVEVATKRHSHLKYTVGGFVDSPIRIHSAVRVDGRTRSGSPDLTLATAVVDGTQPVENWSMFASARFPKYGIGQLHDQRSTGIPHKLLADILADRIEGHDPSFPSRLKDLFVHEEIPLRGLVSNASDKSLLEAKAQEGVSWRWWPGFSKDEKQVAVENRFIREVRWRAIPEDRPYNLVVQVTGYAERTKSRFVRKDLISLVVRGDEVAQ